MGRILAISDIHGQADALKSLLLSSKYNCQRDCLILLGDYLCKDANSIKTLALVKKLVNQGAIALRGNHEEKAIKQCQKGDTYWKKWYSFLVSLPYWFEQSKFLFVHAGIRPGIPIENQSTNDLTTIRKQFYNAIFHYPKTIVFGHTPTHRLGVDCGSFWVGRNKIGIDTGAGHGHFLSLADLTNRLQYRTVLGDQSHHSECVEIYKIIKN